MKKFLLGTALGTLGALAMAGEANADFITADAWVSTEAIVGSATGGSPASLALATCHMGTAACTPANADVTFTINGINFDSRTNSSSNIGDNTPGNGWLGSSPFTKTGLTFNNGVTQATLMDPTIWEFTGTASFATGQRQPLPRGSRRGIAADAGSGRSVRRHRRFCRERVGHGRNLLRCSFDGPENRARRPGNPGKVGKDGRKYHARASPRGINLVRPLPLCACGLRPAADGGHLCGTGSGSWTGHGTGVVFSSGGSAGG